MRRPVCDKKAGRDLFPFGSRGRLDCKLFVLVLLVLQHFTPTLRLPAPPVGKEAVSKSEVIESVCAMHYVRVASPLEASSYYRQEQEKLSRQTWIGGPKPLPLWVG